MMKKNIKKLGILARLAENPYTGSEEFINQMIEALGIIIDKRHKGRP